MSRIRPDVHARFIAVVRRGIAKADAEHAEHLAALRAKPKRRTTWAGYPRPTIEEASSDGKI
jgi:hypothetical protein